jgi:uncharacterized spore protein YtfJ
MALRELASSIMEAATVKRVFGQPIEKDGVVLIPVADVRGGFGGGEAAPAEAGTAALGSTSRSTPVAGTTGPRLTSWGGGSAWSATPAGVYVLKDRDVSWVPAVNANRTILLGCLTGIVALLVVRSIARSVARPEVGRAG